MIETFNSSEWHRTSGTHTESLLEPCISERAKKGKKKKAMSTLKLNVECSNKHVQQNTCLGPVIQIKSFIL